MNKYNQLEKQRIDDDDEDEQVEKTLNFFDSILDQYLTEQDVLGPTYHVEKSYSHEKKPNAKADPRRQPGSNIGLPNYTSTSSSLSSSSSSSRDAARIHPPAAHQHQTLQPPVAPLNQVRRFTSENSLNQIVSSSGPLTKPSSSHSRMVKTSATSTENLSTIPSVRRSNLDDQTINRLIANGTSASLIDLTSIDKVSSRPRFRFVPSSTQTIALKEETEPEPDQQTYPNNDKFHMKTIVDDRTSHQRHPTKPSHQIIKPTVIIPPVPKTAPVVRLTETNIHYPTGHSAFKPHQSSKTALTSKIPQATPLSNAQNEHRRQQTAPQFHQSMMNLSSAGLVDTVNTNNLGARTSFMPVSSHLIKPLPPSTQPNKLNGYRQHVPTLSHQPVGDDPISRWIHQVNNSSSISGLVHPSHNQPPSAKGPNRSQQPTHAYASHISSSSGMNSAPNNSHHHHHHHRPQAYFNPVNSHKYHSPQHSVPVQSSHHGSPAVSRVDHFPSSSNIYHFNQTHSPREKQLRRNPHRPNASITTYL